MDLDEVVARQAGVLALDQAVAAGLSARTVARRVRTGAWSGLHPRVYLVGGHRLTAEARIRAASLWAGPDATGEGVAAAYWHGMMPAAPGPVEIVVPRSRHKVDRPGVRLRRRDLDGADRERSNGLWVTAAPLTALRVATLLEDGSTFLDRALQRHVRFAHVHRAYCRGLGAHGWPAAGRLLVAAADRADSAAERLLVAHLRAAHVTGWRLGHPVGPFRVDLAFPDRRVAVEVDGWAWHVDPERFRADRRKGNALTRAGWLLLRFTWHDLDQRPAACVAEIRAALARPAA